MKWNALPSLVLVALAACGGGGGEAKDPNGGKDPPPRSTGNGVAVSAEIGAIDDKQFEAKWNTARLAAVGCIQQRAGELPYISGAAKVAMRIKGDGSIRWAYMRESTLGDRGAEDCILKKVREMSWPKPIGGEEGLADGVLNIDPSDERPPVTWTADKVQRKLPDLSSACNLRDPAVVTMYVEPDGRPAAVGVAGSNERIEDVAGCIVKTLSATKFPSPGSWVAKVSVTVQ